MVSKVKGCYYYTRQGLGMAESTTDVSGCSGRRLCALISC